MINKYSMIMTLHASLIFKLNFDSIEKIFFKNKINIYDVYVVKKITRQEGFTSLRRVDVLLLSHTSTATNPIILIHQTVIML